jgi:FAD/FMN-containing dehydrogenase
VWDAADSAGLRTPVTTDVNLLTVGGTLSTGGLGGTTFAVGMQVDHVLELDVVTGRGDLVTCSPNRNKELFHAVLGGQGQCGIIVRAVIPLVPAPTHVKFYRLSYTNLEAFVNDQLLLARKRTFDHLYGRSVARGEADSTM